MKRLLTSMLLLGALAGPASAQADVLDMELEQLMSLDVVHSSVPGAHWHWEGDWMVGYQFMHTESSGYLNGTSGVSDAAVLAEFPTIHTGMTMDMHMLMLMYGVSDEVTVGAMVPFMDMTMDHVTRTGRRFTTNSSGLGDISVSAIVPLWVEDPHRLQFEGGVSLPTGAIDVHDTTPNGFEQLEYRMQLGSGTVDLMPAVTYLGHTHDVSWGAQARAVIHPYRNSRGWSPGDQFQLTAWVSPQITESFSPSFRLRGTSWGSVRGLDPELNPLANPEANPALSAGSRLDALLGANFAFGGDDEGHGHHLSVEVGLPIYQSLDGPQLRQKWSVSGAYNWTF